MGVRNCAICGHRASAHARFCERCGTPLTARAERILEERTAIEGERKQVTVMYADIVGSMDLTAQLDGERWGVLLDRFLAKAAAAVHKYAGTVNQFTGDGLLAVFGAPLAHEDHARRACLAVLELQRDVALLSREVAEQDAARFAIRCGLNSGEVLVGAIGDDVHMDFVPLGNTTALGKRIESLAPTGSAAMSASTAALVAGEFALRDLGEFEVKGADAPQRVFELVGLGTARSRLEAVAAARGLSRFVGREAELAALEAALDHALHGDGRAVGIVGDAGVGKSRLVHEFAAACAARGITVNRTAGVAHGRHVPLLAALALFRDILGVSELDEPDVARERIQTLTAELDSASAQDLPLLFEFLGVADPGRPVVRIDAAERQRRLLALLTRTLDARSRRGPGVLVIEDLHWADDASAVFFDVLVRAVTGTRTVLIGTYRPEYEAPWLGAHPHSQLALGPLDSDASDELLGSLLGHDASLHELLDRIGARTGGNPFFMEEIVQALAEGRHLVGARGEYVLASALEHVELPATVQAGLADRIDRLPEREKRLVQTMSVIGIEVPAPLLRAVSPLGDLELNDAIRRLTEAQWVITREVDGAREYVFKHPLTQEVAYWSQLSDPRARAHRAVAGAIEQVFADALDERTALLAHHAERAGAVLDSAGWHARAAAWAEVTSPADGLRHWRRVRELAAKAPASPERDELATQARLGMLGLAWRMEVSPEEMEALHSEASADPRQVSIDLYYAGALMHSGRERDGLGAFREVHRRAVASGDVGARLLASCGIAYASWIAGVLPDALATLDAAWALTDGDPMVGVEVAFVCPGAHALAERATLLANMGELAAARADADRAVALAREHRDAENETSAHANLALALCAAGEVEGARATAQAGLEAAERLADVANVVNAMTAVAAVDAESGRFAEALAQAEENLATIRRQGVGLFLEPLLLATVARARAGLGQVDDALAPAEEGVQIMRARGLRTCALAAPLALADVLLAVHGDDAAARARDVLTAAGAVARESGAAVYEKQIDARLGRFTESDFGVLRSRPGMTSGRG